MQLENGLFCERYLVANFGVGGEVYSTYLTDSTTFKKLIIVYYDSEYLDFDFEGDEIVVNRMYEKMTPEGDLKLVSLEEKTFSIKKLMKNKDQD